RLNDITGKDPMEGRLKELSDAPAETKKLLGVAVAMAKEKNQPFNYNAALILALAADQAKDLDSSQVFYRVCIDQAGKLYSGQKMLQAYGGLIDLLYENRKYDDVIKICKEFLELKSDDGKTTVYEHATDTDDGEGDFVRLLSFDSVARFKPGVHRLMIQAVARQGKTQEALKLVENLVKADPKNWQDLQLKGMVHREAGEFAEAAKVYEDVLERISKDKRVEQKDKDRYLERYRYQLANIYVDLNQIDKAAGHFKELLAKKPDDPTFNNDLGFVWADHDMNLDEAEKHIRKALEEDKKRRQAAPGFDPKADRDNGSYLDSLAW